jgi:hypothetical protein
MRLCSYEASAHSTSDCGICHCITYPTFLSKRIKNSASILGASFSPESTFVALESVEEDILTGGQAAWSDGWTAAARTDDATEPHSPSHPGTLQAPGLHNRNTVVSRKLQRKQRRYHRIDSRFKRATVVIQLFHSTSHPIANINHVKLNNP